MFDPLFTSCLHIFFLCVLNVFPFGTFCAAKMETKIPFVRPNGCLCCFPMGGFERFGLQYWKRNSGLFGW